MRPSQDDPGSSEYPRNPRILRQGGDELCPSWDDPRIVRVSQESQDTQTGGGVRCVHPRMILGLSEYPRNPRIFRQGGGMSCVHPGMIPGSSDYPRNLRILRQGGGGGRAVSIHPGMILGSSEYPRNPRILRQGGGELCPSWDDPRIVRVSQESQDTQTGGG